MLNHTHDPALRSWVPSANTPGTDFPIQNLPFGVFRRPRDPRPRVGVAIGDQVLDLAACHASRAIDGLPAEVLEATTLNPLMALGRPGALREQVSGLLRAGDGAIPRAPRLREALLVPQAEVELLLPAAIGDYTDFYASIHHATNVGSMFRPDNPLLPNYKWVPIGYHGRSSSIVASGAPIRRPVGQFKDPADDRPSVGPSRSLDYELEIGAFVGEGNALGEPVSIADAERHLFGLCLLNDWSARDVQAWEYQPLGPFLGKNFATTITPWVVTLEALAPFRVPAVPRPAGDPAPLPYLESAADRTAGGFGITLEVYLSSAKMRAAGQAPARLSRGDFGSMYWTLAQMLVHHTSNGCNLRPGDLLGSGTVSGPTPDSLGCLLELTWRGSRPLTLPSGEARKFLETGDEVTLRGSCEREGYARIGFGECAGAIQA